METMRVAETAARLGVAAETIRRWINQGKLSAYQMQPEVQRSPWEVTVVSVEKLEEKRRQQLK